MLSTKFSLVGAKELNAKLKELGDQAPKLVRKNMRSAAKVVQDAITREAPEDTGRLRHFIKRKVRVKKGVIMVSVGVLKATVKQMQKDSLSMQPYYARFTEEGTKYQPAQHWMLRAAQSSSREFLDSYMSLLRADIEKLASKGA